MDHFNVLMVDDNPVDGMLMDKAFKELGVAYTLNILEDGDHATSYIKENFRNIDLVILDVNLPGKNGLQILEESRKISTDDYKPIIIFSNSNLPHEVGKAYRSGANAFFVKPGSPEDFVRLAEGLFNCWHNEHLALKIA